MKIGITTIGYQCAEHMQSVLAPWLSPDVEADVVISASHGVFPETATLGYPIKSTDGTIELLQEYREFGKIGNLIITDKPTYEKDLRNLTLPFLFEQNVDLIWLLDLQDEIYTPQDINRILDFINQDKFPSWYKIKFKNYVIDNNHYVDDFVAPRVWRTDRGMGLQEFYYDNEMIYKSGIKQEQIPSEIIPKEVAFIKHLSWVGSPDYLKRKIAFQHNHYGLCSYRWNEAENKLELNDDFYKTYNKIKPRIFSE
jgi:hypothetical protein